MTGAIARAAERTIGMTMIGTTAVEVTMIGTIVANVAGVMVGTTFIVIAAMRIVEMSEAAPALRFVAAVKVTLYTVKHGAGKKDSELADTMMAIGSAGERATFISRRVGATVRCLAGC